MQAGCTTPAGYLCKCVSILQLHKYPDPDGRSHPDSDASTALRIPRERRHHREA